MQGMTNNIKAFLYIVNQTGTVRFSKTSAFVLPKNFLNIQKRPEHMAQCVQGIFYTPVTTRPSPAQFHYPDTHNTKRASTYTKSVYKYNGPSSRTMETMIPSPKSTNVELTSNKTQYFQYTQDTSNFLIPIRLASP